MLLAAYEMKEGAGTTLEDYTGNLPDATFGRLIYLLVNNFVSEQAQITLVG